MYIYDIDYCDSILEKIANLGAGVNQQAQQDPSQQAQQAAGPGSPLGTIGADMSGGMGGAGGAAGGSGGKTSVSKDQLYERLIMEKDNLSKLKMQIAMKGETPMTDQPGMPSDNPMQSAIQQMMIGSMTGQQDPNQDPLQQQVMNQGQGNPMQQMGQPVQQQQQFQNPGMTVQAALKKKLCRGFLDKEAVVMAAMGGLMAAQTAGAIGDVGAYGVEKARSFGENQKVRQNPFLAQETKIKQDRRKLTNATPDAWVGGLGYNTSNRKFNFGGGRGRANSAAYNGVG